MRTVKEMHASVITGEPSVPSVIFDSQCFVVSVEYKFKGKYKEQYLGTKGSNQISWKNDFLKAYAFEDLRDIEDFLCSYKTLKVTYDKKLGCFTVRHSKAGGRMPVKIRVVTFYYDRKNNVKHTFSESIPV